ncbi:hypothetical protein CFK39_03330 [Brachybacterium avium]|uniref:DUF4352 domain-containing protein n=1 Tax=Brachybacterium avium TaxID=2017485 RepID=A0A220UAH5_9MICO|nr:hypothetical protein [Brachybacterium avium]ASK65015.1 hypothetical protein CFK39_03330 [Brachybacterium avium]
METDRHASDGQERDDVPVPPARDGSSAADGSARPAPGPQQHSDASYEYGYGEAPLEAAGPDRGPEPEPGVDPGTGTRPATAPRAVLRPIPEGFPTPPPRPARPNRRPAPKPEPAAERARPRRLLIAGIAVAAVLLLIIVVGGAFLALRSLSPSGPAEAEGPGPSSSPVRAGPASAEIGGVVVTEMRTEIGVRAVGGPSSRTEPEGEFIIVTFEVDNPTSAGVQIGTNVSLETADETYPVDSAATRDHPADSADYGLVPPGGSETFHAVFDVPIGSAPTGLHLELVETGESGTVPLSG